MIQVKFHGSLDQLGSNGYGGKWLGYGYILRLEIHQCANKLKKNYVGKKKKTIKILEFCFEQLEDGIVLTEMRNKRKTDLGCRNSQV